ncbi:MAG: transketolase [Armatimonadetes bacterium CG07_land_8_20_14_0_80_40_9]|nr:MAG: transketolase [Armatimonadetes bacterium CG07_land_8_20_14_0_80_40_9]
MFPAVATREAYGKTLVELGKENEQVVVLDADLSKSTRTNLFAQEFPERFFNFGVAEANMMGTAAGLATCGKIPYCSTFAVFATGRCYDQVRQSIAYPKLNVKIAASHAGITVGEDGASHQTTEDIGLMRVMPNMTILVPADGQETEKCVRAALTCQGPVYIRLGRVKVPPVYEKDYSFQIGKAFTLKEGESATIIACGIMVAKAIAAAKVLEREGMTVGVVNMPTIKPIDEETIIRIAKKTKAVVTAEEHSIIGGLGSAVAEVLGEKMPVPLSRIGIKDSFGESGKPDELLKKYGLTVEDIVQRVKEVVRK